MRSMEPPRVARWLLEHFGCSPNNVAVIGDLDERYRRGRSAAWYWRQTAVALVVSFVKEAWDHKRLTVRAIISGWGMWVVSSIGFSFTREFLSALASWSRLWRHDWITIAVQVPEGLLLGILAGWVVARLCRQRRKAMVLAFAAYFVSAQMVLLVYEIRMRALTDPFHPPFLYSLGFISLMTLGVLIGGGIFTSRRGFERSHAV
jgi:hypothetical protein